MKNTQQGLSFSFKDYVILVESLRPEHPGGNILEPFKSADTIEDAYRNVIEQTGMPYLLNLDWRKRGCGFDIELTLDEYDRLVQADSTLDSWHWTSTYTFERFTNRKEPVGKTLSRIVRVKRVDLENFYANYYLIDHEKRVAGARISRPQVIERFDIKI